jgi:hypothetical protein
LNRHTNNFITKLSYWEFWPWPVIYFPIMLYGVWLSLKARSPFFFFSVNPGIESGGLLIESKKDILDLIPDELKPKTLFFKFPASFDEIIEKMNNNALHFPVIAKPDYGERGWMVEKIEDLEELKNYINQIRVNMLIQEFIDLPVELGIFYYRFPGSSRGQISSIVGKELLHVIGDGKSAVRDLIKTNPRARLHLKELERRHKGLLNHVPARREKVELLSIGNHCRGATFINRNDLIDRQLEEMVNSFARNIPGFYYGRFDIRCSSIDTLKQGRSFKILELNGGKSEPAHIYHPGSSLLEAYRVLFYHWQTLFRIAMKNHQNGYTFPSFKEGWKVWKKYRSYKKIKYSGYTPG